MLGSPQARERKAFAPTPRCLQMGDDRPLYPCMLLCCLSRKRAIISFQVSAALQGNMWLAASDQGATKESENSIISPAIISASSNDFLGDWWRKILQKWEPGKESECP